MDYSTIASFVNAHAPPVVEPAFDDGLTDGAVPRDPCNAREFDDSQDVDEFARALFPELSGSENDFFDDMARQVFAACLKMMLIRNDGSEGLSNAPVHHYFQTQGVEAVFDDLNGFKQFRSAASAINVEASPKQAQASTPPSSAS